MYCKNCGKKLDETAVVCDGCACSVTEKYQNNYYHSIFISIIKALMIISCFVFSLLTIYFFGVFGKIVVYSVINSVSLVAHLSYVWYGLLFLIVAVLNIYITPYIFFRFNKKEHISTRLKIVILLFCNFVAGLLLLCSNADIINDKSTK